MCWPSGELAAQSRSRIIVSCRCSPPSALMVQYAIVSGVDDFSAGRESKPAAAVSILQLFKSSAGASCTRKLLLACVAIIFAGGLV